MTRRKAKLTPANRTLSYPREGWPEHFPGLPPDVEAEIREKAPAVIPMLEQAAQEYRNATAERDKALAASQQARLGFEVVAQMKAMAETLRTFDVGQLEPVAFMEAARRGGDLLDVKEEAARGLEWLAAVYQTVSVPRLLPTRTKPRQKRRDDFAMTIVRLVGPYCPKAYELEKIVHDALKAVGADVADSNGDLKRYLRRVKEQIEEADKAAQTAVDEARKLLPQQPENISTG